MTCKAKHPTKPDIKCVFGFNHAINYHVGGADDSNGNMGFRWPVDVCEHGEGGVHLIEDKGYVPDRWCRGPKS